MRVCQGLHLILYGDALGLSTPNRKTGPLVWGWSLPVRRTCPGASKLCLAICYGRKGHFYLPEVKKALVRNFKATQQDEFVPWMIQELREQFVRVMRPHITGDLYDEEYTRKWIEIVKQAPRIQFYLFTRSWAVPDYYDAIVELGRVKNMEMWLSFDRDMQVPPRLRGFRRCYLMEDDEDQPPCKVDLVFRDKRSTVMKKAKFGSPVCRYDIGGNIKTSCSKCRLCFTRKRKRKTQGAANDR